MPWKTEQSLPSRRTILQTTAAAVSGAAAGVVAGHHRGWNDGHDRGYDRAVDEYEQPRIYDERVEHAADSRVLESDAYELFEWSFDVRTLLHMQVEADDHVDLITMPASERHRYENDDGPELLRHASQMDTTRPTVYYVVDAGEYAVVIDNTARGVASPSGSVDVSYDIAAHQR